MKDSRHVGSAPPAQQLPGPAPAVVLLGPWALDITAATAILRDEPRKTVTLPVVLWARAYGRDALLDPRASCPFAHNQRSG